MQIFALGNLKKCGYFWERRKGRGVRGRGDEANFSRPLFGFVYEKVIDEKNFGGRVPGCHSEIVSTAQTVWRRRT
jgi:hypothetical protein